MEIHTHPRESGALPSGGDLEIWSILSKEERENNVPPEKRRKHMVICNDVAVLVSDLAEDIDFNEYGMLKSAEERAAFIGKNANLKVYEIKHSKLKADFVEVPRSGWAGAVSAKPNQGSPRCDRVRQYNRLLAQKRSSKNNKDLMSELESEIQSQAMDIAVTHTPVLSVAIKEYKIKKDKSILKAKVENAADLARALEEVWLLAAELSGIRDAEIEKGVRDVSQISPLVEYWNILHEASSTLFEFWNLLEGEDSDAEKKRSIEDILEDRTNVFQLGEADRFLTLYDYQKEIKLKPLISGSIDDMMQIRPDTLAILEKNKNAWSDEKYRDIIDKARDSIKTIEPVIPQITTSIVDRGIDGGIAGNNIIGESKIFFDTGLSTMIKVKILALSFYPKKIPYGLLGILVVFGSAALVHLNGYLGIVSPEIGDAVAIGGFIAGVVYFAGAWIYQGILGQIPSGGRLFAERNENNIARREAFLNDPTRDGTRQRPFLTVVENMDNMDEEEYEIMINALDLADNERLAALSRGYYHDRETGDLYIRDWRFPYAAVNNALSVYDASYNIHTLFIRRGAAYSKDFWFGLVMAHELGKRTFFSSRFLTRFFGRRMAELVGNIYEFAYVLAYAGNVLIARPAAPGGIAAPPAAPDGFIEGAMHEGAKGLFENLQAWLNAFEEKTVGGEVVKKKAVNWNSVINTIKDQQTDEDRKTIENALRSIGLSEEKISQMMGRILLLDVDPIRGQGDAVDGLLLRHEGVTKILFPRYGLKDLNNKTAMGNLLHEIVEVALIEKGTPVAEAHEKAMVARQAFIDKAKRAQPAAVVPAVITPKAKAGVVGAMHGPEESSAVSDETLKIIQELNDPDIRRFRDELLNEADRLNA
ncbi:MAG: hypothetical protein WC779_08540, partial [Candidatus Omnitrophota bacterium]